MPETLKRTLLATLALALLCALPALAVEAPQAQPAPAVVAGCHFDAGLFGDLTQPVHADSTVLPAWLDPVAQATPATVFHGFCHCSCSRTPDCNTSADCGGGRCLGGISCC